MSRSIGDVYLLKFILHDWKDEKAILILKSIVAAMPAGAKVSSCNNASDKKWC